MKYFVLNIEINNLELQMIYIAWQFLYKYQFTFVWQFLHKYNSGLGQSMTLSWLDMTSVIGYVPLFTNFFRKKNLDTNALM